MVFPTSFLVPHFGGAWERLVQSTKTIKAIRYDRVVVKEALRIALVEDEAILNSKPITQVSSDAEDWEALTTRSSYVLTHCS